MKITNNSLGFSMVQVLIALGLTAGLGVVIMKNQDTMVQMKMKSDSSQIVDDASRIIQNALEDRAICSINLKGKKVGDNITELLGAKIDPNDYDNYLPTGKKIIKKELTKNIEITKYQIVSDGNNDYLEVSFNMNAEDNDKKKVGGKDIKRRFLLHGSKNASNEYTNCSSESTNLTETATEISCQAMGGHMVNGKCKYLDNIFDTTQTNCGVAASYNLKVTSDNKIKIECTPCIPIKKFIRWSCEKKVKGVNWVNVCYYKSSCSSNPSLEYGVEFWEIGGTSASGGDTGSKKNCKKKRHKCFGES